MQPQENPARVLLGLHCNSTEGFYLKNLYCLECNIYHYLCVFSRVNLDDTFTNLFIPFAPEIVTYQSNQSDVFLSSIPVPLTPMLFCNLTNV